jgi:hypothetical protein
LSSDKLKEIPQVSKALETMDNWAERLPASLKERLLNIPDTIKEIQTPDLVDRLKQEHPQTWEIINSLRLNFWKEYDLSFAENRSFNENNVFYDICLCPTYNTIIKDNVQAMFIMTPVIKYDVRINNLLNCNAVEIIAQILDADMFKTNPDTGEKRLDLNIARLKMSAIRQLENRILGMPTQRMEQKNLNLNRNMDTPTNNKASMEEIQEKIAAVEAELQKIGSGGQTQVPIEAEFSEEDE